MFSTPLWASKAGVPHANTVSRHCSTKIPGDYRVSKLRQILTAAQSTKAAVNAEQISPIAYFILNILLAHVN